MGSAYAQESTAQLAARLNEVQHQLYCLADLIQEHPDEREPLEQQLDEYREEFSGLMKQIRRRKSIAEYSLHNIVINVQVRSNFAYLIGKFDWFILWVHLIGSFD